MRDLQFYAECLGLNRKTTLSYRDMKVLERVLTDIGEYELAGQISCLSDPDELQDLLSTGLGQ